MDLTLPKYHGGIADKQLPLSEYAPHKMGNPGNPFESPEKS